ncbi:hypothetical protein Peur_070498 [Populus x canadensis]
MCIMVEGKYTWEMVTGKSFYLFYSSKELYFGALSRNSWQKLNLGDRLYRINSPFSFDPACPLEVKRVVMVSSVQDHQAGCTYWRMFQSGLTYKFCNGVFCCNCNKLRRQRRRNVLLD